MPTKYDLNAGIRPQTKKCLYNLMEVKTCHIYSFFSR